MGKKGAKRGGTTTKDLWKEKIWYDVYAPTSFNNQYIGKIVGKNPIFVEGRTVETLLYDFTGDFKDISTVLRFKIIKVEGERCDTYLVGHNMTKDYIRSLIRKDISKVQIISNYKTIDNFIFRLTSVCTTIGKARSSQIVTIRRLMDEILKSFAQDLKHEKFVRGMIYGEFSHQIKRVAKTIYPLFEAIIIKSKLISAPELADMEAPPQEEEFEIVEPEVKRTVKSQIARSKRVNVQKLAFKKQQKFKHAEREKDANEKAEAEKKAEPEKAAELEE